MDVAATATRTSIGTGPFKEKSWTSATRLRRREEPELLAEGPKSASSSRTSTRSRRAAGGRRRTALKSLEAGDFNIIHTSDAPEHRADPQRRRGGKLVKAIESDKFTEVSLQHVERDEGAVQQPARAARRIAYAIDRDTLNKIIATRHRDAGAGSVRSRQRRVPRRHRLPEVRPGEGQVGGRRLQAADRQGPHLHAHLLGRPDHLEDGGAAATDAGARSGITAHLRGIADQSTLINIAIGRQFDDITWRNHPGADPDTQYVWWHCDNSPARPERAACDNPVNFSGFNDPEINSVLDQGRVDAQPGAAQRRSTRTSTGSFAQKL